MNPALPYEAPVSPRATAVAAGIGVLIGGAVVAGAGPYLTAMLILAGALLLGIYSWRLSILLMVAWIPFQGIIWVALYPHTGAVALSKDILFVIPAYVGFFGGALLARRSLKVPGLPVVPMGLLAGLVIVGIFNPSLPSALVGMVGAKVWIFYIPMAFVGYHLVRSRSDLDRLLTILCVSAIVPAVVGIVEAGLYYSGHTQLVYSWYGPAASTVTQQFTQISIGGFVLRRVPSTFSFVGQYYVFLNCTIALGYAWWRNAPRGTSSRAFRIGVWILMVVAILSSGMRGAFVFMPLLVLGILLLDGRFGFRSLVSVAAGACAVGLTLTAIGSSPGALVSNLEHNTSVQLDKVVIGGAEQAAHHPISGIGTGSDTDAARYVTDSTTSFGSIGGWQESYWVKSVIELGIAGLVAVALLYGTLIVRGLRIHYRLRDPRLRTMSASILGLLIWTTIYSTKVGWQDFDPLNVFLWLFAGVMFKLAVLDRSEVRSNGSGRLAANALNGQLVAEPPDHRVDDPPRRAREPVHAAG
jgi:hypothetical protein